MPVYRTVFKSDAATAEAAAEFIRQDTGGAVTHASGFAGIAEGDCWRVPAMKATDIEVIRRESLKRQMELWNARITVLYTQSTRWHFQRNLAR